MSNSFFNQVPVQGHRKCSPSLLAAIKTNFDGYRVGRFSQACFDILFYVAADDEKEIKNFWLDLTHRFAECQHSRLSTVFAELPIEAPFGTAKVSWALFLHMLEIPAVEYMDLAAQLHPKRDVQLPHARSLDNASVNARIASAINPIGSINQDCLLGLIDFGFPFAHEQYQGDGGTRIQAIWDQDETPEFNPESGSRPNGFGYGRQVDASTLNTWIREGGNDRLSEGEIYLKAHCPSIASRVTHGSSSLSILAATDASRSLPSRLQFECNKPIVLVQIPYGLPLAPNAGAVEKAILDGITYIVCSAGKSFKKIVISIAYGSYLGPHDGSTRFEKSLEFLVNKLKHDIELNIVFASGNGFDKSVHAVSLDKAKKMQQIDWWLPPGRDTLVFADAWFELPKDEVGKVEVVCYPGGKHQHIELQANQNSAVSIADAMTLVMHRQGDKVCVLLQANPDALSGRWGIVFHLLSEDIKIHVNTAWGGRNPSFERRTLPCKLLPSQASKDISPLEVTGEGSIISTGCSAAVWLVGGYELWGVRQLARYSGGGLAHWGDRSKESKTGVDILAPCEQAPSLPGLLCHGTRSGGMIRENGTSVAAPLFARFLAQANISTNYPPKLPDQPLGPARQVMGKVDFWGKSRIKRGELTL